MASLMILNHNQTQPQTDQLNSSRPAPSVASQSSISSNSKQKTNSNVQSSNNSNYERLQQSAQTPPATKTTDLRDFEKNSNTLELKLSHAKINNDCNKPALNLLKSTHHNQKNYISTTTLHILSNPEPTPTLPVNARDDLTYDKNKKRIKYHYKTITHLNQLDQGNEIINLTESVSSEESSVSASSPPPTLSDDSPSEFDIMNMPKKKSCIVLDMDSNIERNSQTSDDYNLTKKNSSGTSTPRSKSTITAISNLTKTGKPKKRVSFSEDLIQVHLIPFNNYTPYVGIEQYKYQLRMMQASIDPYSYEDYDFPDENDDDEDEYKTYARESNDNMIGPTTEYITFDANGQNFPSLLPRSLQKRYWSSNDQKVDKISNTIILNQRHYASILGNSALKQAKNNQNQQQQQTTKNLLWPSHSFSENSRPAQQQQPPSSASKSSRYYSSSFRSFDPPGSTSSVNSNVATVSFELTDEHSLVKSPVGVCSSPTKNGREKKRHGSSDLKTASSVKYIFLKQDEPKGSNKIQFSSMNALNTSPYEQTLNHRPNVGSGTKKSSSTSQSSNNNNNNNSNNNSNNNNNNNNNSNNNNNNNNNSNNNNATFMSISNFKSLTPELVRTNSMSEMKTFNGHNLPTRFTPDRVHSTSTLNQLFAFKDVNCFVASKGVNKSLKMTRKQRAEDSLERETSELIKVNSASQMSSSKQNSANNEKQRTRSALPLLKNSIRFNNTSVVNNSAISNTGNNQQTNMSFEQMRNNIVQHESQLTMNLNNCFNASSYKLINAPLITTTGISVQSKVQKKSASSNSINRNEINTNNTNTNNIFHRSSGRVRENSSVNKASL